LWVAVVAAVIVAGAAIYFLGVGGLNVWQSAATLVASLLALLFAFFLGLWLAMGRSVVIGNCDGLKSCVAWMLALGGGGLVVFVLVWIMVKFTGGDAGSATVGLPLIVIVGVIVLLVVIALVSFVFSVLGLSSKTEALGLPDGSVRSIIALMLLVLFAIVALYLYNSVGAAAKDSPALDVAKQLITLLGTLVTAVASFYFGSNAVSSAHAAAQRGPGPDKDQGSKGKGPGGSDDDTDKRETVG
jgi:hypothetical protein